MGALLEKTKLNKLVYGELVNQFKENSMDIYNRLQKSDEMVKILPVSKMALGGFYFLHYKDDSNWMRYSPIFAADFRKVNDLIIIYGVNFNFIPLQIRVKLFDKFIKEDDIENDKLLSVNYQGMYNELKSLGFEYSIMEFNLKQVVSCHKINMKYLDTFLISQHPINKYDPSKLMQIWEKKIADSDKRHQEIVQSTIKDLVASVDEIREEYDLLSKHFERFNKSLNKYGR